MTIAYIALGSNLDDPAVQLRRAVKHLGELPHCRITAISSAYASAAIGPGEHPDQPPPDPLRRTLLSVGPPSPGPAGKGRPLRRRTLAE